MLSITDELRALHEDRKGQAGTQILFSVLILSIVTAIVALVVNNVLNIAGLSTGLWTLDDLLLSVIFVLVLIVGIVGIAAIASRLSG